ncbi:hypothetical protein DYQ86_22210 [Acidobacteria bacterium AB60]|nr:hypothetical protein DYQ86_22210 [Acidobacteria bacterium AB60]
MIKSRLKPKLNRARSQKNPAPEPNPNSPPKAGIHFTEAVGKTVAFITYFDDAPDWQSLEVRFTDGTLFSFGLSPQVSVRVDYMESRRGDLEILREYGIVERSK